MSWPHQDLPRGHDAKEGDRENDHQLPFSKVSQEFDNLIAVFILKFANLNHSPALDLNCNLK